MIKSIDIFCTVIDNYGDIGVCWRLAKQMALEYNIVTRLYVNNIKAFQTIIPEPDDCVEVKIWGQDEFEYIASDIVIEAFACQLPQHVITDMAVKKSIWIDLEYLTAENWAISCHAIPSPHPSVNLTKILFFPGFDDLTGGLIRENDLFSRKNVFISDKIAQNKWRSKHFIPEINENTLDISLFCYKTAPIDDFLYGLSNLGRKFRILRPSPTLNLPQIERKSDKIEIINIPFLSQYDYDYLLWTSDVNFVRGEDSFVRAQFAGKPFIWNIYVQEKNAHLIKMAAFLNRIKPFYDESSFESLANLHDLWNEGGRNKTIDTKDLWALNLQSLIGNISNACAWADYLVNQSDLCSRILKFATEQKKTKNLDKD